jgi:N4-bis(aminopropyl)spermidine synthase
MKTADMLLQTEHVGRLFEGKNVVFVGDGDAIGLCLVHLHNLNLLECGPSHVHILDFDERVVHSVDKFARQYRIADKVSTQLYNVADPLPTECWEQFDCFYSNPPFGQRNGGRSIDAFLRRGIEAVGNEAVGCLVIADDSDFSWTRSVMLATQRSVVASGFVVSELLPEFHHYHLDDAPELTSCSMVIRRVEFLPKAYDSKPLPTEMRENFYGAEFPLRVRYVRDSTRGGKLPSRDHTIEMFENREEQNELN